nr:nucleotidyl transferase AbiEii/AbiGii toxin family protein [Nocardia harenae]
MQADSGLSIKIQLLSARDRTVWPTELRPLGQRYGDAPPAQLPVPTLPAFAASKTATWHDRRAPRDLWDLWALAGIGAIDPAAARLFVRHGPTNRPPANHLFDRPPSEDEWVSQLAGQTRLTVTAATALDIVREACSRAVGGENSVGETDP